MILILLILTIAVLGYIIYLLSDEVKHQENRIDELIGELDKCQRQAMLSGYTKPKASKNENFND